MHTCTLEDSYSHHGPALGHSANSGTASVTNLKTTLTYMPQASPQCSFKPPKLAQARLGYGRGRCIGGRNHMSQSPGGHHHDHPDKRASATPAVYIRMHAHAQPADRTRGQRVTETQKLSSRPASPSHHTCTEQASKAGTALALCAPQRHGLCWRHVFG